MPSPTTMVVDPCGLQYIRDLGPGQAGGSSQAIYQWVGIHRDNQFPVEVWAALGDTGHACIHDYSDHHVLHLVSPNLANISTRGAACKILAECYRTMFAKFAGTDMTALRFPPLASGNFAGQFGPTLPGMTADSLLLGLRLLTSSECDIILSRQIHLCIYSADHDRAYKTAVLKLASGNDSGHRSEPPGPTGSARAAIRHRFHIPVSQRSGTEDPVPPIGPIVRPAGAGRIGLEPYQLGAAARDVLVGDAAGVPPGYTPQIGTGRPTVTGGPLGDEGQACAISSVCQLLTNAIGLPPCGRAFPGIAAATLRNWTGQGQHDQLDIADAWWVATTAYNRTQALPQLIVIGVAGGNVDIRRSSLLTPPSHWDGTWIAVIGTPGHFDPIWWPTLNDDQHGVAQRPAGLSPVRGLAPTLALSCGPAAAGLMYLGAKLCGSLKFGVDSGLPAPSLTSTPDGATIQNWIRHMQLPRVASGLGTTHDIGALQVRGIMICAELGHDIPHDSGDAWLQRCTRWAGWAINDTPQGATPQLVIAVDYAACYAATVTANSAGAATLSRIALSFQQQVAAGHRLS